jgi:hypothetical protein
MKKIIIIGLMAVFSVGLMAQTMEQSAADTATIGSKMIYQVTPDPVIVADVNMNASHFDWNFSQTDDTPIANSGAGITLDETVAGSGYYAESTINVTYTAATYPAGTTIKVKTAEVTQPIFGTGCTGSTEEINVFFVAVPTVAVNGTSGGGCGITSWDIPLNITGYGPYDVTFTVEYNQGGSTVTHTESVGAVANKGGSTHSLNLTVNTTTHLNSGSGRYDIVITNIVDRFSGKSQVAIAGSVNGSADTYTIGVNPVPTTQPIQHIRNL